MLPSISLRIIRHSKWMFVNQLRAAPKRCGPHMRPYSNLSISLIACATVESIDKALINFDHALQPTRAAKVSAATKEHHQIANHICRRKLIRANIHPNILTVHELRVFDERELAHGLSVRRATVADDNHHVIHQWRVFAVGRHKTFGKAGVRGTEVWGGVVVTTSDLHFKITVVKR